MLSVNLWKWMWTSTSKVTIHLSRMTSPTFRLPFKLSTTSFPTYHRIPKFPRWCRISTLHAKHRVRTPRQVFLLSTTKASKSFQYHQSAVSPNYRIKVTIKWLTSQTFISPCILTNARSLKNKLPELHHLLHSAQPRLLLVTESWLVPTITSAMLDPDDQYTVLRHDRSSSIIGGGVVAFIHCSIKCHEIHSW